jgi:peptidoglycan/xylan/chitin deacetylase (PgdA/CDA1 family)
MSADSVPRYVWARALECVWLGVRVQNHLRGHGTALSGAGGGERPRPVSAVPSGCVALTLDDGPDPTWTPAALDMLARHAVSATFFLIGSRVAERPALARRVAAAGHTIGNHSLRHPQPFAALRRGALDAEIRGTQEVIEDATQTTPRLFRAPGGGWSPAVLRIAAENGLTPVDWSLNPSDWKRPGTPVITRRLARCRSGEVLLCHDGGGDRSQTIASLDAVIPVLKRRGLRFVALTDTP